MKNFFFYVTIILVITMNKVILTILDGIGIREEVHGNAFLQAKKPNFDYLWNKYPHCTLEASSTYVGLLEGQMGNSEVGHLNIGAGRVVYQPSQLINEKIKDGSFFNNTELLKVINHVKTNDSKLHMIGLLSDSGVHSLMNHFMALLKLAKINNIKRLYFHIITDGRDTPPKCTYEFVEKLETAIKENNLGVISTLSGRYYSMDRDNNYDRIKKGYDAIVNGIGEKFNSPKELIEYNYSKDITDEFIIPGIIDENGMVEENDGIIWVNYRGDRSRELPSAITNPNFDKFDVKRFNNIKLVTMMPVSEEVICSHAFELGELKNTLGEYISNKGLTQLRIAETEKYAHVTYFFDGGAEKELKGCDRILVPSPKVATYDLKPEMSCNELTDKLLEVIDNYDVIILNYANGDMVGHTGILDASIKAVETVDYNLGRVYKKCEETNRLLIVTADHGNCELVLDDDNNPVTSHTTNKVPFIVCKEGLKLNDGKLSDISPTMLELIDIDKPEEMTGTSLIS